MYKFKYLFVAAIAVLGLVSCNKNDLTPATQSNKIVALVDVTPNTKAVTTYDTDLRTNGFYLVGKDGDKSLFKTQFTYNKSINSKAFVGEAYWPSNGHDFEFFGSYPANLKWDGSVLNNVDVTTDPVLAHSVSAKSQYLPLDFYHMASRIGTSVKNESSYNIQVIGDVKGVATVGDFTWSEPQSVVDLTNLKFPSSCWVANDFSDFNSINATVNAGATGYANYQNVVGLVNNTTVEFEVVFYSAEGSIVDIKTYSKDVEELIPGVVYQYNLIITDNSIESATIEVKKAVTVEDWDASKVDISTDPVVEPENPGDGSDEPGVDPNAEIKAQLTSLISECDNILASDPYSAWLYTSETYNSFVSALATAKQNMESSDAEVLMNSIQELTVAKSSLSKITPPAQPVTLQMGAKLSKLTQQYAPGSDEDPNDYEYTEESLAAFNEAYAEAKYCVDNFDSMAPYDGGRVRIGTALNNLQNAISGLTTKSSEGAIDDGTGAGA